MLNNEFPPLGGGTGTVNLELLNQFKNNKDFSIDVITSGNSFEQKLIQFSDNIRIFKVAVDSKNIHHASNFELIKYTYKATLKALKLQKTEKYDLSFAWSTVPAGFVSFLLRILFGLPFIVRVGGPDIPGFEERYKSIYKLISPLIKVIWKKSNLLITKCKTEYDMMGAINSRLKIKTIYNGVDTNKFYPKKKAIQMPLNIICPARLIKRKGQDILIKAIAQLKEKNIIYHINFIGDGDEKYNYEKLAKQLNVSEQIKFSAYVEREKMKEQYQNADLFVLPSYNEGMSNSLLEAMACGLPVIVTDVGGTEELVEANINGYIFNAGDANKLIAILEQIQNNIKILTELGKNSYKKASKLSWENISREYNELFKQIYKGQD